MRHHAPALPILLAASAALTLAPAGALAARPASPVEARHVRAAGLATLHGPGWTVTHVRISTVAPSHWKYASAAVDNTRTGVGGEMLLRGRAGRWAVKFLGTDDFCASGLPLRVVEDLGLGPCAKRTAARAAQTPSLTGVWNAGGKGVAVAGTLAGGITVRSTEASWFAGCPIPAGSLLTTYTPAGGGLFTASFLYIEATTYQDRPGEVDCKYEYRSQPGVKITATKTSMEIEGCQYCGVVPLTGLERSDPGPPDTKRPTVEALSTRDRIVHPGESMNLRFRVTDNSGRATAHLTIYDGGTAVNTVDIPAVAKGQTQTWRDAPLNGDMKGPAFFCLWAEDASGNRSSKTPRSDCRWISLVVPVERVSNGCGGAGWDIWVWAQNYMGNDHTYMQSLTRSFPVSFKAACDLHDAGYGGHSVVDNINGDKNVVHYRLWSRKAVDDKFYEDMKTLCRRAIPDWATKARDKCYSRGGAASIGAQALSDFVHRHGWRFFDADVTQPGQQTHGHRRQFD